MSKSLSEMNEELLAVATANIIAEAYNRGLEDAITILAIWKNGKQVVGVRETPLESVLRDIRKFMGIFYNIKYGGKPNANGIRLADKTK